MKFYLVKPEVAGQLGDTTIIDTSKHPPRVTYLEYKITGWMGDDIMTTVANYVATNALATKLESTNLTGFELRNVNITVSYEGEQSLRILGFNTPPSGRWLHITGKTKFDDFGLTPQGRLIVSEAALNTLRQTTLKQAHIKEYDSKSPQQT